MSASAELAEQIRAIVRRIDGGEKISSDEFYSYIDLFEKYECWQPYFRLIKANLDRGLTRKAGNYVRLARILNMYLEDLPACIEVCTSLISDLQIDYHTFQEDILPSIIELEDYAAEASILFAISSRFEDAIDLTTCLERLCFLYEKKLHNETGLSETYERILEADPTNLKALRHFKLVYSQQGDWENVVEILKTLLVAITRKQELFRVAQELSAVYLYQLDMPNEAVVVIEKHCVESPLDASTILYDAYHRLNDWQGCLKVLRECLLNVDDTRSRAIVLHKMGGLHDLLDQKDKALECFRKSTDLLEHFLEPYEAIIAILLERKEWSQVVSTLEELRGKVADSELSIQVEQAKKRLVDGMLHAKSS